MSELLKILTARYSSSRKKTQTFALSRCKYLLTLLVLVSAPVMFPETGDEPEKKEKKTVLTAEQAEKKNSILAKMLKYGTTKERIQAIREIPFFDERKPELTELMSKIMKEDPDPTLRITVIRTFVKMEAKDKSPGIIPLLKDNNEDIQEQAVYAIQKLDIRDASPALLTMLREKDFTKNENLTASAIHALGKLEFRDAYPFLSEKFREPETNGELKAKIILYYGQTKDTRAETSLLDTANDKSAEAVLRGYAMNSLAKMGSKKSIPHMKKILEEVKSRSGKKSSPKDQIIKIYALSSLARLGDETIIEELFHFARDDDAVVRLRAIKYLKDINNPEVIELLEYKAQRDPSIRVQNAAKKALAELRGEKKEDQKK